MPQFGFWEILLVLILALIIFGPKKLPEMGKALGKSLREFRSASKGEDESSSQEQASDTDGSAAEKSRQETDE